MPMPMLIPAASLVLTNPPPPLAKEKKSLLSQAAEVVSIAVVVVDLHYSIPARVGDGERPINCCAAGEGTYLPPPPPILSLSFR